MCAFVFWSDPKCFIYGTNGKFNHNTADVFKILISKTSIIYNFLYDKYFLRLIKMRYLISIPNLVISMTKWKTN